MNMNHLTECNMTKVELTDYNWLLDDVVTKELLSVVLIKSDIICSKNISFDTILFLLYHYEGYEQCWFIFVISDIALYFCHGCMDTKVTKIENLQLSNNGFANEAQI